jgi:hypothetical protein
LNSIKCNINTGFIPCSKCSDKIIHNGLNLEDIITNRICSSQFPYEIEIEIMYYVKIIQKMENHQLITNKN